MSLLWLIPIGFVVGSAGTLIGLGGGFILVPLLLFLYPHESPEIITCISLMVVFLNASSGTLRYVHMGRVDLKSGMYFCSMTIPASIVGVYAVHQVHTHPFRILFGICMTLAALMLIFRKNEAKAVALNASPARWIWKRDFRDRYGQRHSYAFFAPLGLISGVIGGFLSSFLGIGGGLIHVPLFCRVLRFPVHIAIATSHFILMVTSATGLLTHLINGTFTHGWHRGLMAGVGALVGAQVGAHYSSRLHGRTLLLILSCLLLATGIRLIFWN